MSTMLSLEEKQEIICKNGGKKENILGMLLDFQKASHESYVDTETTAFVAEALGLTQTRVYEIASFYAMLNVKPQARHVLEVCNSSPCQFSRSDEVAELLRQELGVNLAEPTADGMFVYQYSPCVGACAIGPVIKIRDAVYGDLNPDKIRRIIEDLRTGQI